MVFLTILYILLMRGTWNIKAVTCFGFYIKGEICSYVLQRKTVNSPMKLCRRTQNAVLLQRDSSPYIANILNVTKNVQAV